MYIKHLYIKTIYTLNKIYFIIDICSIFREYDVRVMPALQNKLDNLFFMMKTLGPRAYLQETVCFCIE